MLQGATVAGFLAVCLTGFFTVNMYNMVRKASARGRGTAKAEIELSYGLTFTLAALGTGAFFLLSILYIGLVIAGVEHFVAEGPLRLGFPFDSWAQLSGMIVSVIGYAVFLWSVLARGKYATSWEMPSEQKLVTWGPYRYVRHPSYLAYFLLFTGLLLLLLNLLALVPFVAVPGYVHITDIEDEMLRRRFGDAAREYQRVTGRFVPRKRRRQ
jgi:protein-S-isoprenylcysteine O-methyltransferase Ste14